MAAKKKHLMGVKLVSMRMAIDVKDALTKAAHERGLSEADVVHGALRKDLDIPEPKSTGSDAFG